MAAELEKDYTAEDTQSLKDRIDKLHEEDLLESLTLRMWVKTCPYEIEEEYKEMLNSSIIDENDVQRGMEQMFDYDGGFFKTILDAYSDNYLQLMMKALLVRNFKHADIKGDSVSVPHVQQQPHSSKYVYDVGIDNLVRKAVPGTDLFKRATEHVQEVSGKLQEPDKIEKLVEDRLSYLCDLAANKVAQLQMNSYKLHEENANQVVDYNADDGDELHVRKKDQFDAVGKLKVVKLSHFYWAHGNGRVRNSDLKKLRDATLGDIYRRGRRFLLELNGEWKENPVYRIIPTNFSQNYEFISNALQSPVMGKIRDGDQLRQIGDLTLSDIDPAWVELAAISQLKMGELHEKIKVYDRSKEQIVKGGKRSVCMIAGRDGQKSMAISVFMADATQCPKFEELSSVFHVPHTIKKRCVMFKSPYKILVTVLSEVFLKTDFRHRRFTIRRACLERMELGFGPPLGNEMAAQDGPEFLDGIEALLSFYDKCAIGHPLPVEETRKEEEISKQNTSLEKNLHCKKSKKKREKQKKKKQENTKASDSHFPSIFYETGVKTIANANIFLENVRCAMQNMDDSDECVKQTKEELSRLEDKLERGEHLTEQDYMLMNRLVWEQQCRYDEKERSLKRGGSSSGNVPLATVKTETFVLCAYTEPYFIREEDDGVTFPTEDACGCSGKSTTRF